MEKRIGLYGGSYNPVHIGHLIIARAVAELLSLERVVLLPAGHPPHKTAEDLAPPEHRCEMVRLAVNGEDMLDVDRYDLDRPGPAYTLETIRHFRKVYGAGAALYWIIGADSLRELPTWHRVGELADECEIVTAARRGSPLPHWPSFEACLTREQIERLRAGVLTTPTVEIASSDIRARVHADRSIRYLVPDIVREYIERHQLYRPQHGTAPGV